MNHQHLPNLSHLMVLFALVKVPKTKILLPRGNQVSHSSEDLLASGLAGELPKSGGNEQRFLDLL